MEESTKFPRLRWDSHLTFKKHFSVLQTQCKEISTSSEWLLIWSGEETDTLPMLYRAIVCSKLDYGCIVYGTALNTDLRQLEGIHNSGLRLALGAFCTSLYTGQQSSFGGTTVKAVHALLFEDSCLHWQSSTSCPTWIWPNQSRFICSQAKWESRHDPTPGPSCLSQSRGSHDLCRDQCRISLPPEDTQLFTKNGRLQSQATRPHWRSEQMYDLGTRSPG